jgi:hypothetical protein
VILPHPSGFIRAFAFILFVSFATSQWSWAAPPPEVEVILDNYCFSCHDADKQKGEIRLDHLGTLPLDARLDLLNRVQEQLYIKGMPPTKKQPPAPAERKQLTEWVSAELKAHDASTLEDKLRYPEYGNYVDHNQLFSGEVKDKPFTPARRWLVTPQIFEERVRDVFKLEGRDRTRRFYGVTNPFVLPERSGVRDYDTTVLDGGHLLVMLTNAQWISHKQIRAARVKNGELKSGDFPNPKDRWVPKDSPAAFEAVILKKSPPTDDELNAAIQTQFDCVLRRQASDSELKKYITLTREAIGLGGNTEGLRQMLVSVLLESEFLYRLEFGGGDADQFGRKKLSAREASYAISYALGDRNPDAQLVEAAGGGRLLTRDDYKREVTRLLADEDFYKGQIDPSLNGKQTKSLTTSHPKLVRFFRDFFGYPGAIRVFKDSPRSGGYYRNPCRNDTQTPGRLINEADVLVDYYLKRDQAVFKNLLGTEVFFAAPIEDAAAKIDMLNEVYDHLKATDWQNNPKQVAEQHQEFLAEKFRRKTGERELKIAMTHATKFREKGLNPHPVWNYAFGRLLTLWVNSYNIDSFDWDYPRVQPFKIEHRKGLLTHPAWLIAHSQNTETDPVRRGRWIREKLLAGRVPDVPITVDAQVPEDPHSTLRERLDSVTTEQACWKCHQHMNPLGLPFEMFDDFGRYRPEEILEHPDNLLAKAKIKDGADTYKTKALNTAGELSGTGDPELDGEVKDAIDMIERLAKSDRVRQSIIRHAFRYFMGRNELLSDSQTLIDADKAYLQSGGSFKAVVVALLTSDSFIYRKEIATTNGHE